MSIKDLFLSKKLDDKRLASELLGLTFKSRYEREYIFSIEENNSVIVTKAIVNYENNYNLLAKYFIIKDDNWDDYYYLTPIE